MNLFRGMVFALGLMVVGAQPALAHKVNLFAYAEGQRVFVEGYFVDGRRAQNSRVQVFDVGGDRVAEGITNDEGMFEFDTPVATDLRIVLNAGMGHQAEFTMSADELGSGRKAIQSNHHTHEHDTGHKQEANHQHEVDSSHSHDALHSHNEADSSEAIQSVTELEVVVQQAVNEAIKPLVRELADARQQAKISDIVGALGYLFGVLGLFAFYKARQQAK